MAKYYNWTNFTNTKLNFAEGWWLKSKPNHFDANRRIFGSSSVFFSFLYPSFSFISFNFVSIFTDACKRFCPHFPAKFVHHSISVHCTFRIIQFLSLSLLFCMPFPSCGNNVHIMDYSGTSSVNTFLVLTLSLTVVLAMKTIAAECQNKYCSNRTNLL